MQQSLLCTKKVIYTFVCSIQWSMHNYLCNNYLGLRLQNFEEQMDCMINHNGVDMVLNVTAQYHQYIEQYLYLSAFGLIPT